MCHTNWPGLHFFVFAWPSVRVPLTPLVDSSSHVVWVRRTGLCPPWNGHTVRVRYARRVDWHKECCGQDNVFDLSAAAILLCLSPSFFHFFFNFPGSENKFLHIYICLWDLGSGENKKKERSGELASSVLTMRMKSCAARTPLGVIVRRYAHTVCQNISS